MKGSKNPVTGTLSLDPNHEAWDGIQFLKGMAAILNTMAKSLLVVGVGGAKVDPVQNLCQTFFNVLFALPFKYISSVPLTLDLICLLSK